MKAYRAYVRKILLKEYAPKTYVARREWWDSCVRNWKAEKGSNSGVIDGVFRHLDEGKCAEIFTFVRIMDVW